LLLTQNSMAQCSCVGGLNVEQKVLNRVSTLLAKTVLFF